MSGYVRMNGSVGCMPDSSEVYDTREDAIEAARQMFDDVSDEDYRTLHEDLCTTGIHYFTDPSAGADYVSVEPADESTVRVYERDEPEPEPLPYSWRETGVSF